MDEKDDRGSSSGTLTMVLVVVVLLLGLPCLAAVVLFGLGYLWVAHEVPINPPPPIVKPVEPIEPAVPPPVEPPATAPKEGK